MAKKILVIEDDPFVVDCMQRKLQSEGYEVVIAQDGVTGLKLAKAIVPDLITLDIMLPLLNGFTICGLLKCNDKYKAIPIIIVSARDGETDQTFNTEAKPDAYLTKPFQMEILLDKIEELVHHN